jgi:hypothetical protein
LHENFGVFRLFLNHPLKCFSGFDVVCGNFVYIADLSVYIGRCQRVWRIVKDILKALTSVNKQRTYSDRLLQFFLLLVYNAQAKVNFIAFLVVRLDIKDVRESFFGVVKRGIAIIQQTDPVPDIRILCLRD